MFASRPLWERPVLREAAGDTLRPGGFALTDRAAEVMDMLPGWRVLDVGCGLGATVRRLRARFGANAYGVECSPGQVGSLAGGTCYVQAHGEDLPFGEASFSAVFCECVLSLLPDAHAGLREFHRVLDRGGLARSFRSPCGQPPAVGG
jgi:ubiquinone/menaquinone biosynthesis C-methylase UbiE